MNLRFWIAVGYVAVIGALSNVVAIFIKRDSLNAEKFPFRSYKWEKNGKIYDRLKIRKWKSKVPDMSKILKFMVPKKVNVGATLKDIKMLIGETCVAEIIHSALMILSIAVFFICPGFGGVFIYFMCLLLNLPFIFIQRYNRPQYIKAAYRLVKREERKKQCGY